MAENKDKIICFKCKIELPQDSEFCQYCGSKVEIPTVTAPVKDEIAAKEQIRADNDVVAPTNEDSMTTKSRLSGIIERLKAIIDSLYNNIGGKIKIWAKWVFIVEALFAIISGIYMIADGFEVDDFVLISGIVTVIFGPCVALISTWLLYAFGQIVEDVHAIRNKERRPTAKVKAKQKVVANNKIQESQSVVDEILPMQEPDGF